MINTHECVPRYESCTHQEILDSENAALTKLSALVATTRARAVSGSSAELSGVSSVVSEALVALVASVASAVSGAVRGRVWVASEVLVPGLDGPHFRWP